LTCYYILASHFTIDDRWLYFKGLLFPGRKEDGIGGKRGRKEIKRGKKKKRGEQKAERGRGKERMVGRKEGGQSIILTTRQ
jgi:hypothetical protein